MDYHKKILIIGTGISGVNAGRLLLEKGAEVILYDDKTSLDTAELLSRFDKAEGVHVVLGELKDELLSGIELAVISPGVPVDCPTAEKVRECGIPIWSEIELAYHAGAGRLAAITGTNGKTTTTSLVGEIFKAYTDNSFVVGNIGIPYTEVALQMDEESYTVAEVSSFQLETIVDFKPHVSAVLNVTPDHLNRHYTMENYASVKLDVCKNQNEEDYLVLNYDDAVTRTMAEDNRVKAKVIFFSRLHSLENGVCLDGDTIVLRENGDTVKVIGLDELILLGGHNVENYMAGIAVAYYMGIPMKTIVSVLKTFKGVEHRIEFVKEVDGVAYYNDSKGTNPDAAIKGIQAMNRRTVLIGGGYDKGAEFDDWINAFDGKVKKLVLFGATAKKIAESAKKCGFQEFVFVDTLEEAVKLCAETAEPGEAVLLSPACASWDMFESYEQRGDMFKKYVNELGA
ncbi:MAG: UDP-N-acetylmuramoyl-L-alanine--D-glutamate ligase [Lachnospiraceae bacterium]|nr:UDP-N-acetylmuramoyl-L-alanine--D-glutamate ligase [Lachnospiraceae bacterium]MDE6624769.1 UDP-N-acetylmuramoyl-L-alanine--D-glutamate ligase [Lachnospiraceae bacterium]